MVAIEAKTELQSNYWLTSKKFKICESKCEGFLFVMFGGFKSKASLLNLSIPSSIWPLI
jgi:hypothetical protein